MFSALKKEMALTESRKLGGPGLLYSWHLFNGVTFKYFFPLQVASKTSVPRAATHMRDFPFLAGWPADEAIYHMQMYM